MSDAHVPVVRVHHPAGRAVASRVARLLARCLQWFVACGRARGSARVVVSLPLELARNALYARYAFTPRVANVASLAKASAELHELPGGRE